MSGSDARHCVYRDSIRYRHDHGPSSTRARVGLYANQMALLLRPRLRRDCSEIGVGGNCGSAAGRPTKKGSHRAMDDLMESIEELKYYRKALFLPRES